MGAGHDHVTDFDGRLRHPGAASNDGAQTCHQLEMPEWLDEIVVRATVESVHEVALTILGREDQHGSLFGPGPGL